MQWVMLMGEQDALQGRDCLALIAFFHICSWKELILIDYSYFPADLKIDGSCDNMLLIESGFLF